MWTPDAARMRDAGIRVVRLGEFAWSRLEPAPGRLRLAWLRRALDILRNNNIAAVLATPSACPPRWMHDRFPDLPPVAENGTPLGFGSRRHYCHAHSGYRRECVRLAAVLAREFGRHPAVAAWQIDNEYACHNTARSHSPAAAAAFRKWLRKKHKTVAALNRAWGNAFWSMEYARFSQVNPPAPTPAENNPAHRLDFARFTSDSVREFNRAQVSVVRRHSPNRPVLHNFMGFVSDFDHFKTAADLDIAAWDSYPLGFLQRFGAADGSDKPDSHPDSQNPQKQFARTGHPDHAAFHHDLYRACGRGEMWVMEQQPGPVNWAPTNPDSAPGMVRLWTWEAFAHGAKVVSYFRWRQAPFAQEQMHSGLRTPDDAPAPGLAEARRVADETESLPPSAFPMCPAEVAMVMDYESAWALEIQPHGDDNFFQAALNFYGALRRAGVDVDIIPPDANFRGRKLVVVPALFSPPPDFAEKIRAAGCVALFGPRCGSKTPDFAIPDNLPPGVLRDSLGLTVERVESLPDSLDIKVKWRGRPGTFRAFKWREVVRPEGAKALATFVDDNRGALFANGKLRYLACRPSPRLADAVVADALKAAGIKTTPPPPNVRVRRRGDLAWFFNYGDRPARINLRGERVLGNNIIPPAGVAAVRVGPPSGVRPRPGTKVEPRLGVRSRPGTKVGSPSGVRSRPGTKVEPPSGIRSRPAPNRK